MHDDDNFCAEVECHFTVDIQTSECKQYNHRSVKDIRLYQALIDSALTFCDKYINDEPIEEAKVNYLKAKNELEAHKIQEAF